MSAAAEEPIDPVAAHYRGKTESILRKYGPGPRVHYHTGIVDPGGERAAPDRDAHRAQLVRAQERLLDVLATEARVPLGGTLLDVGCGLGGSSLYLVGRGIVDRAIAITHEPGHAEIAQGLARDAGLADRVEVLLRDAHAPPDRAFESAIAIESSCYLDRARWLRAMRARLRPGGVLHVIDCLLVDPGARGWFDARWRTRIGTEREYAWAAARAGLEPVARHDLAPRALAFWDLGIAWSARHEEPGAERDARVQAHGRLRDALARGAIAYVWTELRKP